MNPIEHTSSPKMANPRDRGLPKPRGSGKVTKVPENYSISEYHDSNNIPDNIRTAIGTKNTLVVFGLVGNKKL